MSRSSYVILTAFFVLLFMILARLKNEIQPQITNRSFIELVDLKVFEMAVKGDLSWCKTDKKCISRMISIKTWGCIADACAQGGSKDPTSCIYDFKRDKDQGNKLLCNIIKAPGPKTRQAFLETCPEAQVEGLAEGTAYFLALKGNAAACQDQIKEYKGPYGAKWDIRWYGDLSGCRILAGQRTREEEEKDFSSWFESKGEVEKCLAIDNVEMRDACRASHGDIPDLHYAP